MSKTFAFALVLALGTLALAMPALAIDPPPFGGGSPDPIPVDGGASLLAAGGITYAVRRFKAMRTRKATV